jgi:hypothetical protein
MRVASQRSAMWCKIQLDVTPTPHCALAHPLIAGWRPHRMLSGRLPFANLRFPEVARIGQLDRGQCRDTAAMQRDDRWERAPRPAPSGSPPEAGFTGPGDRPGPRAVRSPGPRFLGHRKRRREGRKNALAAMETLRHGLLCRPHGLFVDCSDKAKALARHRADQALRLARVADRAAIDASQPCLLASVTASVIRRLYTGNTSRRTTQKVIHHIARRNTSRAGRERRQHWCEDNHAKHGYASHRNGSP